MEGIGHVAARRGQLFFSEFILEHKTDETKAWYRKAF